ncbi:MAG: fibronectin type III domain-containing protein [bacterium]|nr:fibronectin type III domain-containing protein [bacterium]
MMNTQQLLALGALILSAPALAQSIRVGPVLQDASPERMWVMWETTSSAPSVVEYGQTPALGMSATGSSGASQNGARIHHTMMGGLLPDTVYYYRVGSGSAISDVLSFRTPAEISAEDPFRFAALSDTQGGPISDMHTRTINDGIIDFVQQEFGPILHDELDFVIQPGDLVSTGSNYDQWKDQYFDETQNLYQHVPIYPVPGNHEQDAHWFFDYFKLPENGTPGYEEHWWYKDHGNIRLIGLDSNGAYRIQAQLDWLDAVLDDAATNDDIDFVFAQLHHPHLSGIWTPGNTAYTGQVVERMEAFSEATGKPSIHFFGHTHAYERGQSKDHNHMWVNVAAGEGGIDYWDQSDIDYDEFQRVFPEWGFVIMEVEAGDDPQFRLRRINRGNNFIDRDNEVMDDITIKRYNELPNTPTTQLPSDGDTAIDPDLVQLQATPFNDPDGGFHLESEFQLTTTQGDFSNPEVSEWIRFENWFMDEGASGGESGSYSVNTVEDADISKINIELLDGDTTYYWRVRYRDSGLGWSDWSGESSFTTGPAPTGACCFLSGICNELRENVCIAEGGQWLGLNSDCENCPEVIVASSENFDAVPLGPGVDEGGGGDQVWTDQAPGGWNVDRSGVPSGGVTEWRGWGFADPDWWASVAGDQGRTGFTQASGATAIADPDEWDDAPHDPGTFNTWLESPVIDVSMLEPGSAKLAFSSSWRPEDDQRAIVAVSFDAGSEIVIADWQSQQGDNFKPDAVNEMVVLDLPMPEDAQTLELRFGLLDAGNDWWWAIDNVVVVGEAAGDRITIMQEDFESLPLGPSIDEPPASAVWTETPPSGWELDDTGVPSVGIVGQGVTEWEGWAFTDRDWWVDIADNQRRSEFVSARGTIAVADPDEWDDLGDPESLGPYNAIMRTGTLDVASARASSIRLSFDSSWRPEDFQRAQVRVSFDNGPQTTLLDWRSVAGDQFHPDATNERISIDIQNPPGAMSMELEFAMLDAANDWWWAIDNVVVTGLCASEFGGDSGSLDFFDVSEFLVAYQSQSPTADLNMDQAFNFFDVQIFLQAFLNGCG